MTNPTDCVEIITSVQRRRRWTASEKVRMVEETFEPGMTVSLVARRHGVAPNQLFPWRRLVAQGGLTAAGSCEEVVPASDYRALHNQVRELHRLLGKKTLAIDPTEPMFGGSHHQVTHVLASDVARSGEEAHSFTITAVQCEGNPHLITVVTANLEAVGAPTPIAFIHGDVTVVPPLGTTGMAIEHETVGLHHSVDSFMVGRLAPGSQRPPLEDGMDPPVAVGRQLGGDRLDLGHD